MSESRGGETSLARLLPPAAGSFAALVVLVVLLASLAELGSPVLRRNADSALILLVVVVGLYTFVGNSGIFSFGHMSFMALGAYTSALLTIPVLNKSLDLPELPGVLASAQLPPLLATLLGGLVAAVFAAVIAVPLMRVSGLTAGLATVALLIIVRVVAANWDRVTAGTAGLAAIPTTTTHGVALAWALVAMLIAYVYQSTPAGLRLRSSREDDVAARSIGVRVARERGLAFVLSGFLVGVGGGLYAQFQGNITPDSFYLSLTFLAIAMLVIGGLTSLAGAVIGTLALSAVTQVLRTIERGVVVGSVQIQGRSGLTEVGLALLMLITLILRPSGLTGGRELSWPWARKSRTDGARPPEDSSNIPTGVLGPTTTPTDRTPDKEYK